MPGLRIKSHLIVICSILYIISNGCCDAGKNFCNAYLGTIIPYKCRGIIRSVINWELFTSSFICITFRYTIILVIFCQTILSKCCIRIVITKNLCDLLFIKICDNILIIAVQNRCQLYRILSIGSSRLDCKLRSILIAKVIVEV